jgi:hypothetical protein
MAWSHGKFGHIPGFVRRREALRLIETKAHSWASEQTGSSFRGRLARRRTRNGCMVSPARDGIAIFRP